MTDKVTSVPFTEVYDGPLKSEWAAKLGKVSVEVETDKHRGVIIQVDGKETIQATGKVYNPDLSNKVFIRDTPMGPITRVIDDPVLAKKIIEFGNRITRPDSPVSKDATMGEYTRALKFTVAEANDAEKIALDVLARPSKPYGRQ